MRSYDVAVASLAIDAPTKWTDNLLSQHKIPGVSQGRRGVARRVARPALVRIAITRILHAQLGLGVAQAVRIASSMIESGTERVLVGGHLTLVIDRAALERQLDERLANALESAPSPRRGRPARRH